MSAVLTTSDDLESNLSLTLTGQALIMDDIRLETPDAIQRVLPLLKGDVVYTNFEIVAAGPEVSRAEMIPKWPLFGPPATLDVLQEMGFNLMSLSHNHSFDLGVPGILSTLAEVKARNIVHAGTGANITEATAPGYIETSNGRVALVSMASGMIKEGGRATSDRPGVNEIRMEGVIPDVDAGHPNAEDTTRVLNRIREAAENSDLVIAYHHNHHYDRVFFEMMREELPQRLEPPTWFRKWTHEMVDAGANIVVSHGAPVLQGVEIYNGSPIFFDLGNFIFQLQLDCDFFGPTSFDSVVAHLQFRGKKLSSIEFQPITMNVIGKGEGQLALRTRGIPAPATGRKAGYILQKLIERSEQFGTVYERVGDLARVVL